MRMSSIQSWNEIASVIKNNFPKVKAVDTFKFSDHGFESLESGNNYQTMMNLFDLSHNIADHNHRHFSNLSADLTSEVFENT